jgi:hypothetical protein
MTAFRRIAAVGASAIATVVLAAASASAATVSSKPVNLCVSDNTDHVQVCAYAVASGVVKVLPVPPTKGMTNWYYPTSGFTTIKQANTNRCLQVDHDAVNEVIQATCATAPYQQWKPVVLVNGQVEFQSKWVDPAHPSVALCLTYDNTSAKGTASQKGILKVQQCKSFSIGSAAWYQLFS